MAENGVIDATAEEVGTDVVPAPVQPPTALFRTDDPVEVITKATEVANALKGVVSAQGLIANIGGKEHPQVEAWQTLGAMLGVFPNKEWVRPVPWPTPVPEALKAQHKRGRVYGYEASFQAVRGGEAIGGGEAMCTRDESKWKDKDDYALRSMAQTRATSKALAAPLRFVMTLAGYSGTPAEEMDGVGGGRAGGRAAQQQPKKLNAGQRKGVLKAIAEAGLDVQDVLEQIAVDSDEELMDTHWPVIQSLIEEAQPA